MTIARQCIGWQLALRLAAASVAGDASTCVACAAADTGLAHQPSDWMPPIKTKKTKRNIHQGDFVDIDNILVRDSANWWLRSANAAPI
jgi:hypothetical protein